MFRRTPKVLTPEQAEEIRTKDFFDCILPGTVNFSPSTISWETATAAHGWSGNTHLPQKNRQFSRSLPTETA